jgi:hypothetical protein
MLAVSRPSRETPRRRRRGVGSGSRQGRRKIDRRKAMNFWHGDCVLQMPRTFDWEFRSAADRRAGGGQDVGPGDARRDGGTNFLGVRVFIG